jgi:hypothetical protein
VTDVIISVGLGVAVLGLIAMVALATDRRPNRSKQ